MHTKLRPLPLTCKFDDFEEHPEDFDCDALISRLMIYFDSQLPTKKPTTLEKLEF